MTLRVGEGGGVLHDVNFSKTLSNNDIIRIMTKTLSQDSSKILRMRERLVRGPYLSSSAHRARKRAWV